MKRRTKVTILNIVGIISLQYLTSTSKASPVLLKTINTLKTTLTRLPLGRRRNPHEKTIEEKINEEL